MKFSFRPNYQPGRRFQQPWNQNNKRRGVGGQGMRLDMEKRFKSNNVQAQGSSTFQKPKCPKYRRYHTRICMEGPRACYNCGKMGHLHESTEFKYQNQRKFQLEYLHLLRHRQRVAHLLYQVMYLFIVFLHMY